MANKYSKKGLSTIVVTVLLILLSITAVGVVWAVVNNMLKQQMDESQSCLGNYEKVKLNLRYTCYERIGSDYSLRFSLSISDINVDKVIVGVSSESSVKSYEITNITQNIAGLSMYPSGSVDIILPGMNSGLSYKADGFTSSIDSIEIAPVIGGNKCQTSDSVTEIENCAFMA